MRVFVNAVSIREGGPRVVLIKLLAAMRRASSEIEFCVAAPPAICEWFDDERTTCFPATVGQSPASLFRWYELGLLSSAKAWKSDVIFSMTNYLSVRPLPLPTLLLEQHAGHFSPTFERLMMEHPNTSRAERLTWPLKRAWVRWSCKKATVLSVQTAALANAVSRTTGRDRSEIRVIPHGPGWVDLRDDAPKARTASGPVRIGYLSKFGVQKNFLSLFRAARRLADEGIPIRLVLTLDTRTGGGRETLIVAGELGLSGLIENHGEVAPEALTALYDSLDVFVFPSLCESFGMPMVEAMARGVCVLVADTPENREIVGDAGLPFSALDPEALVAELRRVIEDEALRSRHANLSLRRAAEFSWQSAATDTLGALQAAVTAR